MAMIPLILPSYSVPVVEKDAKATKPWFLWAGGVTTVAPLRGTGSPAGVVVADAGTLYLRTDGGAGQALYVKENVANDGTSAGWVAK